MCTVTSPGFASIAAAMAVEQLTSVLQHPQGVISPILCRTKWGFVPHLLCGFLAQFRHSPLTGPGCDRYTGRTKIVRRSCIPLHPNAHPCDSSLRHASEAIQQSEIFRNAGGAG
ncbi:uncharacterized protein LACBIDRAFT_316912 [Laccaria bicolor S238N-H82]|uniref:Predicted protein n=1 Tax=Laccaria bicolor (strain S238N-H82 / ATCC MYA-4686) TaxID=486041 RepID=B0D595_LACBS|nr:uncharacterized protein LACBIDRAFT_316912 [Laccaria bicolor S238N-H82]EDR10478.1 predicted protein [Laccaria bicolor S238N-H82]|eukprot:XP_001878928.1 predicted protein [Laccaria bicolor S238N-H82]